MPTIFLSHNYQDKPVVEPVAVELMKIFGQDSVFYDDWSIQPGDSIIGKMNDGLTSPDFFLFFITENSLKSGMVNLEWQSALYQAAKGNVTFIPVRVDGVALPAIVMHKAYVDMHRNGIEATIQQIKDRIEGKAEFTPKHTAFSNLTYTVTGDPETELKITVKASLLQESNPKFMFLVRNGLDEVFAWIEGAPGIQALPQQSHEIGGVGKFVRIVIHPLSGNIRPNFPMTFTLKPQYSCKAVELIEVLHETKANWFEPIPGVIGI
ncbi:toll/interleukin-1 receptor domain-containing protein [Pseudomonas sp. Y24-6]|uniref:toll/interleukin-1 receptor domain-containing protein n=1 Tax=Pseudomonas sp. Y24-6 TaxID=2750013 RepID=UPI001CE0DB5E|nr:toll/interleukin-1 receptor domain-containing protein [Pseudomonas sp. Y24-6]MCA4963931.1 toll/interleukin-1 receptor domain-containing protein [Pseudomonas sp. Y24-6]